MVTLKNGRLSLPNVSTPPPGRFLASNGKTVYCRDVDTAIILSYIAHRWHREVEKIGPATHDLWPKERNGHIVIHSYRPPGSTVGAGAVSVHRGGDGMDINGHIHPFEPEVKGDFVDGFDQEQRDKIREICMSVRTDAGLIVGRTGLDFERGKRDGMHTEIGFRHISPGGVRMPFSKGEIQEAADRIRRTLIGEQSTDGPRPRGVSAGPGSTSMALVRCIQHRVTFFVPQSPFDGKYGDDTARGVKGLQRALGLEPTGRYGPNLARADFKRRGTLSRDDKGSHVRMIQFIARVEIDGKFGRDTERALKKLQAAAGLVANGTFAEHSREALFVP